MKRVLLLTLLLLTAGLALYFAVAPSQAEIQKPKSKLQNPLLVAHRGASGYLPEHTLAAYELAIAQGADFVEQDLQVTKDGHLICAHDAELSRTTDVRERFPDRATERDVAGDGAAKRGWYVVDFTLAEIQQLDAGSWFFKNNSFAKSAAAAQAVYRVPTLAQAIAAIHDRAGLYIEMKHAAFYQARGFDMAKLLAEELAKHGYADGDKAKRVFIQSFSKPNLLRMREVAPQYPRVQLLPMEDAGRKDTEKITAALAAEIAAYAQGVGPSKSQIHSAADVATLHAAKLVVHPYTFRGTTSAISRKPLDTLQSDQRSERQKIIADIERYLSFGIDGGFTDYPAVWREVALRMKR